MPYVHYITYFAYYLMLHFVLCLYIVLRYVTIRYSNVRSKAEKNQFSLLHAAKNKKNKEPKNRQTEEQVQINNPWKAVRGYRESMLEWICGIIGFEPGVKSVEMIEYTLCFWHCQVKCMCVFNPTANGAKFVVHSLIRFDLFVNV